jgi:CheY-like chemotaxis protein
VKTPEYVKLLTRVSQQTTLLLGHTRMPTKGSPICNDNNHPVQAGPVFGVHNGHIANDDDLFQRLDLLRLGQVDSEIIFRILATISPTPLNGGYLAAIQPLMQLLQGQFTFLACDQRQPAKLLVLQHENPLCIHFHARWNALIFSSRYIFLRRAFGHSLAAEALDRDQLMWFDAYTIPQRGIQPVAALALTAETVRPVEVCMRCETILIIDDSLPMLEIVKQILVPLGYTILEAVDGMTGLELAVQHSPDLILLDMNMPRMTGLEMLAELRQTPCHSPVIFMTVFGSEHIAVEAFRLGVRDYLNKPFTTEEVKQAVDRALRETRLAREHEELNRNLLTAEAVRVTVITLSHYLNNYLTTLKGGLTLLEEHIQQELPDPDLLNLLKDSRRSAASIQAVMRVLLCATNVQLTSYTHTTPILDIEAALRQELSQLPEFKKA